MLVNSVPIDSVKIARERFREDVGNIRELKESLVTYGQLQPIIITEDGELVDGFRRLSAAKELNWTHIDAVVKSEVDEFLARSLELETNIQRLDMNWYEKAKAIAEIDRLKRATHPNWSREMTMAVIGSARPNDVTDAVKIVKMVELFPELKDAKSLLQATSWASAKAASVVRVKEVRDNPAEFQEVEDRIWLDDSVEAIKRVPEGMFRLILTDPPFSIDLDNRKAGTEQAVSAYPDSEESYRRILAMASDLYRVLKPDGWLIWFFGPTHYERCKTAFREVGFIVDEMPIVWDRSDGRCYTNRPDRYFTRGYDLALHCLKGSPEITPYGRGKSNVLRFTPLGNDERELLVERPIELYQELIKRLTHEGESVADFFVGSGSVLAAAASLKREYFGCEIDPGRRAYAIKKVKANTP